MKTLLTPVLLKYLIAEGYQYCLSKTESIDTQDASVAITLVPIKTKPHLRQLAVGFDTYFNIKKEPVQLALGVDDTLVMVEIDSNYFKSYINFFLLRQAI